MNMTQAQLELSFDVLRQTSMAHRTRPAANTRRWWFERMREIVDRAQDWEPAPAPRPEQTAFGPMYRQAAIAALVLPPAMAAVEEQLIVE